MNNEVYERLARVETIVESQTKEMDEIKADLKALTVKADQILSYAKWGQGAVWAVLKVAGLLAVVGSAIAWFYDRFFLGPHT